MRFSGKSVLHLELPPVLAKEQGWMAEHMLIVGVTNPKGEKKYIAAASFCLWKRPISPCCGPF